ncbi:MAG: glycosyltransferase family 87 protein, partial [Planctomycetota bacterium]
MTEKKSGTSRLSIAAGLALVLICCLFFAHAVQTKVHPSAVRIGTVDFIAYWTAYQLYEDPDLDPYDGEMLLQAQRQLGADYENPQMVWNVPLIFPLLAPVMRFSFDTAVTVWFGLNCFFVFLISLLTWKTITDRPIRPIACILAGAISFPVAQNIYFGQLSVFITLGVILCFWSIKHEKDWLAGIALLPLALKPHLAYLVILL